MNESRHATPPLTPRTAEQQRHVDQLNDEAEAVQFISFRKSEELASQALTLASTCAYPAGLARARMLLGYAHFFQGRPTEALAALTESAQHAAELALPLVYARSLNGLGIVSQKLGQTGKAFEYHLQCLQIVQDINDELGQARSLNNIGNIYLDLKEHDNALTHHTEALELSRRLGHATMISTTSLNTALDYHMLGRFEEALSLNEHTLATAQQARYRHHACLILANMAANLLELERLDEALHAADQAITESEATGELENLCDALIVRGRVHALRGDLTEAEKALTRAVTIADEVGVMLSRANARTHLSQVLRQQREPERALTYLSEAVDIERELQANVLHNKTQMLAAQLRVERLEHLAAEERLRNQKLTDANAALQAAQERLAYQARHDALTGLLNRAAFEATLHAALEGPAAPMSVLFVDLDHFKQVNDTLGHDIGDQLLIEVADRLKRAVRDGDLVARQGGDEFTVLLRHVHSSGEAATVAQRILEAVSAPLRLAGRQLVVTASIGIAMFPDDGMDVTTLQKNADLAMYLAKQERRAVRRFEPALSVAAAERLDLEQDLRAALNQGELTLHYQPIVDAATLAPVALEALVRWQHPTLGLLGPARFIPVAEESDLILPLGAWVLDAACRQLRAWRRTWPHLRVAVNVAPRQLAQLDFASLVMDTLAAHHLPPDAVELEVTEGAMLDERGMQQLGQLARAQLNLSLDDFGTGYSSLARLHQLPARTLKIDRTLVQGLHPNAEGASTSRPIVRALLTFARESGLRVVAEGVETTEQLEVLRDWNCELAQGYLISRPASSSDIAAWLTAQPERDARTTIGAPARRA